MFFNAATFLLRRGARTHRISVVQSRVNAAKRYSILASLSEGFLDLAVALPYPPSFPPYSSTIILVTVLTRLVFTVPVSIWAKKRDWRIREIVVPRIETLKPVVYKRVLQEMQTLKVTGSKEELRAAHAKRSKQLLTTRRNQLLEEHNCKPLPTILAPVLTQLPVFVLTSAVLAQSSKSPTPFDSESFLTLTSLAHADPTATLPVILGIATLANVESSRWFMTEEEKERERKVDQWTAEKRAQGHFILQPKKHVQSALRILSLGRIIVGALVPGSVVLYWVTSATFGLFQTWLFDWWEARRRRTLPSRVSPSSSSSSSSGR